MSVEDIQKEIELEKLIDEAISVYRKLPSDKMALDYLGVKGAMRGKILSSERYKESTRKIYAEERMKELRELDELASASMGGEDEFGGGGGSSFDKDAMNFRWKSAVLKREILKSLESESGANEREAMNIQFVPVTREELEKSLQVEVFEGKSGDSGPDADDVLDEILGYGESAPSGSRRQEEDLGGRKEETVKRKAVPVEEEARETNVRGL